MHEVKDKNNLASVLAATKYIITISLSLLSTVPKSVRVL